MGNGRVVVEDLRAHGERVRGKEGLGDPKFQISWRLDICNPVKMTPVLHPGVGVKSDR